MDSGVNVSKSVYLKTLSDYISDLQAELDTIEDSLVKHKSFLNGLDNRKAEISMEIERVKMRMSEISKSESLEQMGLNDPLSQHNAKALTEADKKVEAISKEMTELKKQYAETNDYTEKAIIKNKINFKDRQLELLYQKRVKIGKRQRTIMLAKNKIEKLRSSGAIKQQINVAKAEAKAEEIDAKIEASVESDNPIAALLENANELKKSYYLRKAENARTVLEQMDNKSFIKGARAIGADKAKMEKLRERMKTGEVKENLETSKPEQSVTPPSAEPKPTETPEAEKEQETAKEMVDVQADFDIGVAALTGGAKGL